VVASPRKGGGRGCAALSGIQPDVCRSHTKV
jgi:hypothetical protein